jgi:hypothetical protein
VCLYDTCKRLGYGLYDGGSFPDRDNVRISFSFATASRTALGLNNSPIQWVSGALFPGVKRWRVKLTTDLHLMPRLRMRGDIPPISQHVVSLKQETRIAGVVLS